MSRARPRWGVLAAISLWSLAVATATSSQAMPSPAMPQLPERLDPRALTSVSPRAIVVFRHDVSQRDISRLANAGVTHASVFERIDAVAILGPRSSYVEIARWQDVASVEDDSPISFDNYVARGDTGVERVRSGRTPLHAPYTGKGVTVAVVDTGIDTAHPDLGNVAANVNMEPAGFLDDITDGEYSEQYAEEPVGVDPEYGHGTLVAGIVGGSGSMGQNVDQSGVAPGTTLVNVRVGFLAVDYHASEVATLAAYEWILDHRNDSRFPGGIRVATNSWGMGYDMSPNPPGPLVRLLRKVVAKGIAVVFGAGNGGPYSASVIEYPNSMEEVITVGAICKSDQLGGGQCEPGEVWVGSSRGPQVDVVAPGVRIWSTRAVGVGTVIDSQGAVHSQKPGDPDPLAAARNVAWYGPATGTSFSTPHVAGIVALMLEANPRLTPLAIERILIRTARDAGLRGFDDDYGFGVVDAHRAVVRAERWTPAR